MRGLFNLIIQLRRVVQPSCQQQPCIGSAGKGLGPLGVQLCQRQLFGGNYAARFGCDHSR